MLAYPVNRASTLRKHIVTRYKIDLQHGVDLSARIL